MQANVSPKCRETKRWHLSPCRQLVTQLAVGKITRAICPRTWKLCNVFWKRRRKNYKLQSWIRKALMEKLRNRHATRTRLLPSKLFRAVLIFQLMDQLNPEVRRGRHSSKPGKLPTRLIHS